MVKMTGATQEFAALFPGQAYPPKVPQNANE